ncbi:retron St85 family effector protein [Pedobacter sp. MC2016-14]|uniref:retron St85 family effector protein n=1 Tax=Pedobacter sp. MC2016-14 TaxID=2897327 RepID=UPI001E5111B4|nr:retron St85 family effector protein [Pedobacter sp. MC2016-14]MCD0490596.1 retron St85 family effector protein [Pedobacter sp. MC2016-14]
MSQKHTEQLRLQKNELSLTECKVITDRIMKYIFEPARNSKTTIFLCGKDISDLSSIRYKISDLLGTILWYGDYDIIYPEDIFETLLYKSNSEDLLSLENLLADSVDVVVVIPESAGSFAELGAFANNEKLRKKMVCVLDKKYHKDKSFINQGPVKLLKRTNHKAVVHVDPELLNTPTSTLIGFPSITRNPELEKVVSAIRNVKKNISKSEKKLTLLSVDRFLLPAIYLLEPVGKMTLTHMTAIVTENEIFASSITETALSMLIKKRWVQSTAEGYRLTSSGVNAFLSYKANKNINVTNRTKDIDNLRLEILNLTYRNKKLRV